ncbi:MAG TPA: hypothetical protein VNJ07_08370 [Chitinophagales bacterium]|nr:hypothetical protein [Chitinophagales bacterium]
MIHFLLGLAVSFAGSLPPGVISLTVMDTAVRKSLRQSAYVAGAASAVEFFQSYIAILFSKLFMRNEMVSTFIHYGAAPVFLLVGMLFLLKDKLLPKKISTGQYASKNIAKGMMVGLLNVFVIPFWVFWSSYFASNNWIDFKYSSIAIFSAGITAGTMLALMLYARIGLSMANKTAVLAFWGNKTLGLIFIAFGIYQAVQLFKG